MIKNGFVKVSLISPKLEVGNPDFNVRQMLLALADNPSAIAVFPELGIPGYTCSDLFFHKSLFDDMEAALGTFLRMNQYPGIVICGIPVSVEEMVMNCAIVVQKDRILGAIPKMYLPSTKEYYDRRWFKSGFDVIDQLKEVKLMGQNVPFGNLIFSCGDIRFGIEICEDMWATITPGNLMSVNGANVIINLSASNETLGKDAIRRNAVLEHSRKNCGIYLYCSSGASESTSETVFSGHNIVAENGSLLAESNEFSLETEILYADLDILKNQHDRRNNSSFRDSLYKYRYSYREVVISIAESPDFEFVRKLDSEPFVPKTNPVSQFNKIAAIQQFALAKRMTHLALKQLVIGVSGGLDSALALLVAVRTFDFLSLDRKGIIAVTMPGLATSSRTQKNAKILIESLGVTHRDIDLKTHILDHLELIGHDQTTEDTTYENTQARARTMVLMNLANKLNGLVLGTGDLSEIALGWSTYNGDQMSMYNVNAGIPKTVVRFMIQTHAEVVTEEPIRRCLFDILGTPITPELKQAQSTEAVLGKYEINDFILYRFLVCGDTENRIRFLLKKAFPLTDTEIVDYTTHFFHRFYSQQFKRQASPDSPKIMDISLSPRSDFRMPADVKR